MGDKDNLEKKEECFVIMPISDQSDYPKGHFQKVYEQIFQPAIEKAGYLPYRVDENVISDRIIDKIFNAIQECPMALCDLSSRNPNVLYELGIRQAYDKPVVLVQDEKTDRIFDVSGISTVQYKSQRLFEDVLEARDKIAKAIVETKEGRQNSIVKIVQAKKAQIPSGDVSGDEKIEIMLSGIVSDLKEIKAERNVMDWIMTPQQESSSVERIRVYTIQLKQGTTNSRIEHEIERIEQQYDGVIKYTRKGDFLTYESFDIPPFIMDDVTEMLKNRLGK